MSGHIGGQVRALPFRGCASLPSVPGFAVIAIGLGLVAASG